MAQTAIQVIACTPLCIHFMISIDFLLHDALLALCLLNGSLHDARLDGKKE